MTWIPINFELASGKATRGSMLRSISSQIMTWIRIYALFACEYGRVKVPASIVSFSAPEPFSDGLTRPSSYIKKLENAQPSRIPSTSLVKAFKA